MKLSKNIAKTLEKQIVPINASSDKCLIDITDIKTSPHIINRSRNLILEIKAKNKVSPAIIIVNGLSIQLSI